MDVLEDITVRHHDGFFVDLFVRASNKTAIQMYTNVRTTLPSPSYLERTLTISFCSSFFQVRYEQFLDLPPLSPFLRTRARAHGEHEVAALIAPPMRSFTLMVGLSSMKIDRVRIERLAHQGRHDTRLV